MGLFSSIANGINKFNSEVEEAKLEAIQRNNPDWVIRALQNEHSKIRCLGYGQALRTLMSDMSDHRVWDYYKMAYYRRNIQALFALKPILEDRGYEVKRDDGGWVNPENRY